MKLKEASASTINEYFLKGIEPTSYCNKDAIPSAQIQKNGKESADSPVSTKTSDFTKYQIGGWYPVGKGGKALQFWNGEWFDKPQQDKKNND